ncbi:hypothetical protein CDL15_Pgr020678 [Punica granatum]|uniref:Uncharacterized protein n=1 Tax=Punica granatum TaxID=22663 RepID=A0A218XE25_PUNGR|nr:hypothetical protein CDL15_Pgr020678 [Punica granatum]
MSWANSSCGFGEGAGNFSTVGELRVSAKSRAGSSSWASCGSRREVELGVFGVRSSSESRM